MVTAGPRWQSTGPRGSGPSHSVTASRMQRRRRMPGFTSERVTLILLLNGAFGIGKTSVARRLVARLPRAVLYDPEIIGIALQRAARIVGWNVPDFQDLRLWRRLTITA